jgi:hypothetical protein
MHGTRIVWAIDGPIDGSLPCAGYASSAGPTTIMTRANAV